MADIILVTEQTEPYVVEVGVPGRDGTDGAAGAQDVAITAAQALGGRRAVLVTATGEADYADNQQTAEAGRVLGITTGAASAGATSTVRVSGELTEPTWTWTPGQPVFLGTNGGLTQSVPLTGIVQVLAIARSATTLVIDIRTPHIRT